MPVKRKQLFFLFFFLQKPHQHGAGKVCPAGPAMGGKRGGHLGT